ncbi:MAG TPA: carboxypeptidase regulatory-like domain-containing protein [Terriglobales bacterium]|nr:carboxypeptidase regulatory-like domain-containing protein [Terriglobales bacterium]
MRLAPVPALHILFRSPSSENRDFAFPLLQRRAFDGFERPGGMEDAHIISPGVFELMAAPGKYAVRLTAPSRNASIARNIAQIDLTQDRQEIDSSASEAFGKVRASIRMLGEDAVPRELFVVLRDPNHRVTAIGETASKGEVDFGGVAPGTYEVIAASRADSYSVVRIGVNGQESSGHTLHVPAGTALSVNLGIVAGSARIVGFARRAGKPVAGAMVVLIPKHPGNNADLFRRDQSDLDGSFSLSGVIPGSYTVTAIEDGWKLDWSRPEVISKYAAHGTTIVVSAEKGKEFQLSGGIEVQPP